MCTMKCIKIYFNIKQIDFYHIHHKCSTSIFKGIFRLRDLLLVSVAVELNTNKEKPQNSISLPYIKSGCRRVSPNALTDGLFFQLETTQS